MKKIFKNLHFESNSLGILVLLSAAFLFSTSAIFNRMIGVSAGEFTGLLARTVIPAFLFGLVYKIKGNIKLENLTNDDKKLFLFRAILTVIDFLSFFYAINRMPMGITLLIFYASYLFVSFIYSQFFKEEKVGAYEIFGLVLALIGILLVYNFDFSGVDIFASLGAIVAGSCYALSSALSKPLTKKFDVIYTNFITYFISGIFALVIFLVSTSFGVEKINYPLSTTTISGIVLIGLNTFITFYLTLLGYKLVSVTKASLILLSEIVFTFIVGYIVYHEKINLNESIGSILIISALALPLIDKNKKSEK